MFVKEMQDTLRGTLREEKRTEDVSLVMKD